MIMDCAQMSARREGKKKLGHLQYQETVKEILTFLYLEGRSHQTSKQAYQWPLKRTDIFQKFLLINFYIVSVVPQKRPDVRQKLKEQFYIVIKSYLVILNSKGILKISRSERIPHAGSYWL